MITFMEYTSNMLVCLFKCRILSHAVIYYIVFIINFVKYRKIVDIELLKIRYDDVPLGFHLLETLLWLKVLNQPHHPIRSYINKR